MGREGKFQVHKSNFACLVPLEPGSLSQGTGMKLSLASSLAIFIQTGMIVSFHTKEEPGPLTQFSSPFWQNRNLPESTQSDHNLPREPSKQLDKYKL